MIERIVGEATSSLRVAESASVRQVAGKGDLVDVATAIGAAEVALEIFDLDNGIRHGASGVLPYCRKNHKTAAREGQNSPGGMTSLSSHWFTDRGNRPLQG